MSDVWVHLPFHGLPLHEIVSLTMRKLFSFMRSHWSVVDFSSWASGTPFRKFFPTPGSCRELPMLASDRFLFRFLVQLAPFCAGWYMRVKFHSSSVCGHLVFFSTICCRYCHLSSVCFWHIGHRCQKTHEHLRSQFQGNSNITGLCWHMTQAIVLGEGICCGFYILNLLRLVLWPALSLGISMMRIMSILHPLHQRF